MRRRRRREDEEFVRNHQGKQAALLSTWIKATGSVLDALNDEP